MKAEFDCAPYCVIFRLHTKRGFYDEKDTWVWIQILGNMFLKISQKSTNLDKNHLILSEVLFICMAFWVNGGLCRSDKQKTEIKRYL